MAGGAWDKEQRIRPCALPFRKDLADSKQRLDKLQQDKELQDKYNQKAMWVLPKLPCLALPCFMLPCCMKWLSVQDS